MASVLEERAATPTRGGPPKGQKRRWPVWIVSALLLISGIMTLGYAGISVYGATVVAHEPQIAPPYTPAIFGLDFRPVTFPSREDKVQLRGWLIPGVRPDGQLTVQRTIIVVHGRIANRADPSVGILELSSAFARHGFAVLSFDMRGNGESPAAPLSYGYFEQRDVLGAVDFLRSGPLPYPGLGRPRAIGGWGISMGAATLLFAAAKEPAIQAVVSDDAFAAIVPLLEREGRQQWNGLLSPFVPGALIAARALYGVDYYAVRPVDVVAKIAPRPLFFIHPEDETYIPLSNFHALVKAASAAPNAHVQSWQVPWVNTHGQAMIGWPVVYIERVTSFFAAALGPDRT